MESDKFPQIGCRVDMPEFLSCRTNFEVEHILADLGLTASETILLLYRQIKLRRGLPFEVAIPNTLTCKTLRESKAGKNVKRFNDKKHLYADLGW